MADKETTYLVWLRQQQALAELRQWLADRQSDVLDEAFKSMEA
jgi:hypothetical protein